MRFLSVYTGTPPPSNPHTHVPYFLASLRDETNETKLIWYRRQWLWDVVSFGWIFFPKKTERNNAEERESGNDRLTDPSIRGQSLWETIFYCKFLKKYIIVIKLSSLQFIPIVPKNRSLSSMDPPWDYHGRPKTIREPFMKPETPHPIPWLPLGAGWVLIGALFIHSDWSGRMAAAAREKGPPWHQWRS